jgi:hypothetical protein
VGFLSISVMCYIFLKIRVRVHVNNSNRILLEKSGRKKMMQAKEDRKVGQLELFFFWIRYLDWSGNASTGIICQL